MYGKHWRTIEEFEAAKEAATPFTSRTHPEQVALIARERAAKAAVTLTRLEALAGKMVRPDAWLEGEIAKLRGVGR